MQRTRQFLVLLLLSITVIALPACGRSAATPRPESGTAEVAESASTATSQAPTPVPVNTAVPTIQSSPTAPSLPEIATPSNDLELSSLTQPVDLDSYRSSMKILVSGVDNGQTIEQTFEYLVEYTREPLAQRIVVSGSGSDDTEAFGNIEVYRVEDTTYMKFGDEWLSMPATEDDPLSELGMIGPDQMLDDTCGWKKGKKTKLNGINVQTWTISKDDLEACMVMEDLTALGQIEDVQGELYIAEEDQYVVKMSMSFEGTELEMGVGAAEDAVDEGTVEFIYEVTDINAPFAIDVPEEALTSSSLPDDIPIPADAQDTSNMFGMITFTSDQSPEDLAEFYQSAMLQSGWTEVSAEEFSGMYSLEYDKDGRTASIMINSDESGVTSAMITLEEPE